MADAAALLVGLTALAFGAGYAFGHFFCRRSGAGDAAMAKRPPERFDAFARQSSAGLIVVDARGIIRAINPSAASIFAIDQKKMVGSPLSILVNAEGREEIEESFPPAASRRMPRIRAHDLRVPAGMSVAAEWARIADEDGQDAYVLTVLDTTAWKRTETALEEARREADEANQGKTRFLAAVSHDLRQPLHALDLLTGALADNVHDDAARDILNDMQNALGVMRDMLNKLLDISKLDAGVVTPEIADFHIGNMLRRLASDYRMQAAEAGLPLTVVRSSAVIRSDPGLLSRIVGNFISNAIAHAGRGRILVGCRRLPGAIRIEVWDTGIGIPAERLEDIFEAYQQLGNPARQRDHGLGLGLAVAERLARLLDHQIGVRSWPGKGTVFSVTVPLGEGGAPRQAAETLPRPAVADLAGTRVLLIEDDLMVRKATILLLNMWGVAAYPVSSLEEWQQGQSGDGAVFEPDLLIVDYRLQGALDGFQSVEAARGYFGRDIPAIIITGDTAEENLTRAHTARCQLLYKPVDAAKLMTLMRNLLREGSGS